MTSSRPYLLRALYQWIIDNGLTPHLLVNAPADTEDLEIPWDFVESGKIVLNVSPMAVRGLLLADEAVRFNARFRGRAMDIYIPMNYVLAIYARENGQGMLFGEPETSDTAPAEPSDTSAKAPKRPSGPPHLRVVK